MRTTRRWAHPSAGDNPEPPPACPSIVKYQETDFFTTPGEIFKCLSGKWVEPRG